MDFTGFYLALAARNEGGDPRLTRWWWKLFRATRYREICFVSTDNTCRRRHITAGKTGYLKYQIRLQTGLCERFHFFVGCNLIRVNNSIFGCEGLIDIDRGDISDAVMAAQQTIEYATTLGWVHTRDYHLNYTGKKGFHFIVTPQRMMKSYLPRTIDPLKDSLCPEETSTARAKLHREFTSAGIKMDSATKGAQQVRRLEYSIHPDTMRVCTPLKPKQLTSFNPDDFLLEKHL